MNAHTSPAGMAANRLTLGEYVLDLMAGGVRRSAETFAVERAELGMRE